MIGSRWLKRGWLPALIVGSLLAAAPSAVGGAARSAAAGPYVGHPVPGVATPPLKSFARVETTPGAGTIPEGLPGKAGKAPAPRLLRNASRSAHRTHAVAKAEAPTATLGGPIVNVAGQSGGNPPDPVGDVGPNDYVQMVNTTIAVYTKTGTLRGGFPVAISSLWSTLPAGSACSTRNDGDPIVVYDQQVDRWMVSQFTDPTTPRGPGGTFPMCIAYSQTGDPTGSYYAYQFNLPASEDYEKYGIWPDGLYMSTWEGGGNVGAYVFDRSAMLSNSPATFQYFNLGAGGGVDGRGSRILPADWDGDTPPPAGAPNPFVISYDGAFAGGNDRLEVYNFHVDWANPANSTFGLAFTLNTAPFDTDLNCGVWAPDGVNRLCIPQPGTGQKVDALANRPMWRLQYRNFGGHESMVVSQTVDADANDRAGVRWYELRHPSGNWSIYQQGTYAPQDGVHRWLPSAAMDGNGNIAIGYGVSDGTSTFPGIRYTGRTPGDPLGSLPAGEQTLQAGTTSQTSSARWGDYSSLNVDPVDDCTFWYTNQLNGSFGTQIGSFRFSDCGTDLAIRKSVSPADPIAGDEAIYTITVSNLGAVGASSVVVTDTLPTNVAYLANTDTCTGVPVDSTGTLTCQLATIAAGASKSFQIKVRIDGDLGGAASITNTASVTSATADPNTANNAVSLTHLVNESADVAVTKFCKPDTSTPAGTDGICQIFVHNYGPSAARNVSLIDTHVSNGAFTIGTVAGCSKTTSTVTCNIGKIQPDDTVEVDVPITSPDAVDVNDTAVASSATPDPNNANNQAQAGLTFTASADLSITKDDSPDPVTAGNNLTYTLTASNSGPSKAKGVTVVDTLPPGVTFQSATPSVGTFTHSAGVVTWNVGDLNSGASATLTLVVKVNPQTTGQLDNSASISSQTSDPDTSDNSDTETTAVSVTAGLSISKVASPSPVTAGSNLTYTVVVTNSGPSTATNIVVTDPIPDGTTFVSAQGSNGSTVCAEVQAGIVSCDVGTLDPGQSRTIFITVHVAPSVPDQAVLHNCARVSSPSDSGSPRESCVDTTVQTRADIWIDKQGAAPAGNPAGALIYLITVHNAPGSVADDTPTSGSGGPSDAQGIVVTDPLPLTNKKVTVQFLSPGCTYSKATHTVTCRTATLPYGTAVTFQIQIQIQGSSGTVTNIATVTSTTTDPTSGNNRDTVNNVYQGGSGRPKKP